MEIVSPFHRQDSVSIALFSLLRMWRYLYGRIGKQPFIVNQDSIFNGEHWRQCKIQYGGMLRSLVTAAILDVKKIQCWSRHDDFRFPFEFCTDIFNIVKTYLLLMWERKDKQRQIYQYPWHEATDKNPKWHVTSLRSSFGIGVYQGRPRCKMLILYRPLLFWKREN